MIWAYVEKACRSHNRIVVDQMKDSPVVKGKGIPRKTIGKSIKKDLDFNGVIIDMVYNKILWICLIHGADHT